MRMTGRRKSTLAVAAIVGGMLVFAAGCMQTQEIDQTMPPYASISDEARDPASAPKPPPSDDDNSRGFLGSAFHFILVGLGFHVD